METVTLEDLIAFATCPAKFFFRSRFGDEGVKETVITEAIRKAAAKYVSSRSADKNHGVAVLESSRVYRAVFEARRVEVESQPLSPNELFTHGQVAMNNAIVALSKSGAEYIVGDCIEAAVVRVEEFIIRQDIIGLLRISDGPPNFKKGVAAIVIGAPPSDYSLANVFAISREKLLKGFWGSFLDMVSHPDKVPKRILYIDPASCEASLHNITKEEEDYFANATRILLDGIRSDIRIPYPDEKKCTQCRFLPSCGYTQALVKR